MVNTGAGISCGFVKFACLQEMAPLREISPLCFQVDPCLLLVVEESSQWKPAGFVVQFLNCFGAWRIKCIAQTVLHLPPSFIVSFHVASGRSVAAIALDTAGVSIREREAVLLSEGKACLSPGAGPTCGQSRYVSVMSHRGCYRWCRVTLQRVKKILMELRSRMNVTKWLERIWVSVKYLRTQTALSSNCTT